MTAIDSYHDLTDQGFNFWLDDGALKYRAPKGKMTADILAWLKASKKELISLLAKTKHYEKIAVSEVCPKLDVPIPDTKSAVENIGPTWFMDRYAHLITCQQCEHLTSTGYCRVKPQIKPIPEAMQDCGEFNQLKTERINIENKPYSKVELNYLLGNDEKELFHHLLECRQCDFEAARYCPEIFTTAKRYDNLLLSFNDAASKREALLNTVIRARISGRKVFVGLDYANIGELPQTPVKPLVYGIADTERPFVNHLGTCTQCKPASRVYCAYGLHLKANT